MCIDPEPDEGSYQRVGNLCPRCGRTRLEKWGRFAICWAADNGCGLRFVVGPPPALPREERVS